MQKFQTKRISPIETKEKTEIIPQEKNHVFWTTRKIIIGLSLLLLTGAFSYVVGAKIFQTHKQNGSENYIVSKPSIIEAFLSEKIAGTTNILIAGIGGKGHDGSDLTDSIMLASLNGEKKNITFISIPRDLYVSYGDRGGAGRINTLYDLGKRDKVGIKYLAEKVTEITGQKIDQYIVIDFSGFKEVINILGGITVDVPEDLLDREYPDNNWGYMVFSVKKGLQKFDGETALRYARSRHSTSDFDRSNRQQLILKGIKEKAAELGYITSPDKIGDLYNAVISHLDTDLSLAKMAELAFDFREVKSEDIRIISLSEGCFSVTKCAPGSYLYSPSRDLFGGQAVIIPENAHANRLSYYDDIRRFVDMIFRFPNMRTETRDIVIVSDPSMKNRAKEIGFGLAKLGFPLSFDKSITSSTGTIEKSHVNIYWHDELKVGIDPESERIMSLKYLEEGIPYTIVEHNEYINTSGPKIEIIIGKDGGEYFTFLKNPYYLPIPPKSTISGEGSGLTISGKAKEKTLTPPTPVNKQKDVSGEKAILPGEWENF